MDYVLITNWKRVSKDDFYLIDKNWRKKLEDKRGIEIYQNAIDLVENEKLYYGYTVLAKNLVLFSEMDATMVFINFDGEVIMECEGEIINNKFESSWEYNY